MMYGEYSHTVDAKGRMFLPAKFRTELGETVFLARDIDKCVCIYPVSEWEKYVAKIKALPLVKTRNATRLLLSTAREIEVDAQGRVLIPAYLREYAGLGKDVTVIGVGEKAEIWDTAAFESFKNSLTAEELEKELLELGL